MYFQALVHIADAQWTLVFALHTSSQLSANLTGARSLRALPATCLSVVSSLSLSLLASVTEQVWVAGRDLTSGGGVRRAWE